MKGSRPSAAKNRCTSWGLHRNGLLHRMQCLKSVPMLQLAAAKDQNTSLRIACGELQQLLAMQKAAAAERDSEIVRLRAAMSVYKEPSRSSAPGHLSQQTAQRMTLSLPSAEMSHSHGAVQHELVRGGKVRESVETDLADKDKQISRLRAALSASERHRERQAVQHKQELETLCSTLEQVSHCLPPPVPMRTQSRIRLKIHLASLAKFIKIVCHHTCEEICVEMIWSVSLAFSCAQTVRLLWPAQTGYGGYPDLIQSCPAGSEA